MDKVITEDVQVAEDVVVELVSDLPEVDVNVKHSITAEIQPDTYVIASQGYSAGVPGWVSNYIKDLVLESIGTGSTLKDALDLIRTDLMGEIALGVSQAINQVENEYVSNSALTTTLASEIGASRAAILEQVQTYADATQAVATEVSGLKASFGGDGSAEAIEAFIGNIALAYANEEYARAETVTTLQATYNDDIAPKLESVDFVVSGYFPEWDGLSTPEKGMYKVVAGVHYTYVGGTLGDNGWVKGSLAPYAYADEAVSALETTTGVNLEQLQAQIDGEIDSWYYNYIPDQTKAPWSSWLVIDNANGNTNEQTRHLGDLFYDLTTGTAYRFALTGSVFGWAVVTDTAVTLALANSSIAQYTADGKASVYLSEDTPSAKVVNGVTIPIELGDIWVKTSTGVTKVALRDNPSEESHWGDITNTETEKALIAIAALEETNDGLVTTFYRPDTPTLLIEPTMSYGDWWVKTDVAPLKVYRYEDSNGKNVDTLSWVEKDPSTNILANAMITSDSAKLKIDQVVSGALGINLANATIDGSQNLLEHLQSELDKTVVVYSGNNHITQTGMSEGDIYIETTTSTSTGGLTVTVTKTYKYVGISWVEISSNDGLLSLADLADGKRTIYGDPTTLTGPVGELNDIWIPTSGTHDNLWTPKEVYQHNGTVWVIATKYTEEISTKARVYYTTPANKPTLITHPDLSVGDQWVSTVDGVIEAWSGSAWISTSNQAAIDARIVAENALISLADLEEARDGNVAVYYLTTTGAATGMTYGDYLVDTDSWNGTIYTTYRYENSAGGSSGTLAWYVNTGEVSKSLSAGYRAQVLAGTAQGTADGKVKTWYQVAPGPILTNNDIGDMWVDTGNEHKLYVWAGTASGWLNTSNQAAIDAGIAAENARNGQLFNANEASPPTATGKNDIWVVTDRWYTNNTGTTVQSTSTKTAIDPATGLTITEKLNRAVKIWDGSAWVLQAAESLEARRISWVGGASKLLYAPDGGVTGWEFADGSDLRSEFKISAQKFYISDGVNGANKNYPFEIDGTDITFRGKVTFSNVYSSDGTTLDEASFGNPVVYRQTTTPTGALIKKDDLWQNGTVWKKYDGSAWVTVTTPTDLTGYIENDAAAGVNSSTTTIDGGRIDTDSLFARNITYTGTITGGTGGTGGIIQSKNYVDTGGTAGMRIDLVNGSIYIA